MKISVTVSKIKISVVVSKFHPKIPIFGSKYKDPEMGIQIRKWDFGNFGIENGDFGNFENF